MRHGTWTSERLLRGDMSRQGALWPSIEHDRGSPKCNPTSAGRIFGFPTHRDLESSCWLVGFRGNVVRLMLSMQICHGRLRMPTRLPTSASKVLCCTRLAAKLRLYDNIPMSMSLNTTFAQREPRESLRGKNKHMLNMFKQLTWLVLARLLSNSFAQRSSDLFVSSYWFWPSQPSPCIRRLQHRWHLRRTSRVGAHRCTWPILAARCDSAMAAPMPKLT